MANFYGNFKSVVGYCAAVGGVIFVSSIGAKAEQKRMCPIRRDFQMFQAICWTELQLEFLMKL
jgi:hypothetical protein